MAGDVADEVCARLRCATERARAELAFRVAIEDDAHVLEFHDVGGCLAAHDLDGVLVGQIVASFDRVKGVRLPCVALADSGVDAALRSVRMTAQRVDLGDDGNVGAAPGGLERRPHPGKAGTQDDNVVIGYHAAEPPRLENDGIIYLLGTSFL